MNPEPGMETTKNTKPHETGSLLDFVILRVFRGSFPLSG